MATKVEIEDTYAEAFKGIFCRIIVTADDARTLRSAAHDATATPSVVIGRVEGGIEKWLSAKETPDHRKGAVLQFWGATDSKATFADCLKKFEAELSYRIRQDILVKPFTAVFDALPNAEGKIDMTMRVGHCGDGYEWVEKRHGREVIVVPIMVPDFIIEHYIGYASGVMGANFWIMCKTNSVSGVVTPFDVCSAGSKTESQFPLIGPTTNHPYCPSLKRKLGEDSLVPKDVRYVPEIVINGVSMQAVKTAMKAGVEAAVKVDGVVRVSAGNYGGKLGEYKIHLRELFP
jgi:formylmethanofuran--tetrahydromethanopterin N-formyltransferase